MFALEKINVQNYRKFINEDIFLNKMLTAIAGSNNAGKTSVVELMSNLLTSRKDSITIDDLNHTARSNDLLKIMGIYNDQSLDNEGKLERLQLVIKELNSIQIFITVSYDHDDSLTLFNGFLSDLVESKRNYYFCIEYKYKKSRDRDVLETIEKKRDIVEHFSTLETFIYYCNESAEERVLINNKEDFYKLFNYHCVYALRKLSDTSEEKQNHLSKHLLKTVKNHENWNTSIGQLIDGINELLRTNNLSEKLDDITIDAIKQTLEDFSKTNGGNTGRLGIDFLLESKDIEKVLLEFTKIYFEQDGGGRIKEQKQGLGYSNLIYLLLETQLFKEKLDKQKVNLLVFEEPEAHLHPQMQNVFIQYLNRLNIYDSVQTQANVRRDVSASKSDNLSGLPEVAATSPKRLSNEPNGSTNFQMMITTHSSEMAKSVDIFGIRVLRPINHLETKVFDLYSFIAGLHKNEKDFYLKFFQFNMVEMIFADKLVLFEGDAERLLLKYLLSKDSQFLKLSSEYISYIQVGGAFAHNYLKLIDFLKIRTLIYTDIDYKYESSDLDEDPGKLVTEILKRKTSNKTIEYITGENVIRRIFKSQVDNQGVYNNSQLVCLKFQTQKDGLARTLEDAILSKLLSKKTVFEKISKEDFNTYIASYNLHLSGPQSSQTSIRDRIDKLQNKTDFMFALIASDHILKAVPQYILEGLIWLQK
ncbi:AAA family ATPase [Cohnella terricola]|uniref:AAA family ATPase n=1 Tax=Cohnella terricola TaxID=1289167 RepID=A0A559JEM9_9BACL|nr:AAA family ATPase [Cohnella terricola]TVX98329.1 AAA family ATPase [Cohnella terricola]